MAWADTLVHPIEAEDNAVVLIRFESGALGQFEVSWSFRGGMDLRDEVAGTEGTIWLNHFLRTGFEMYSSGGGAAYVAEKLESTEGWLFPVGDEIGELGYTAMFADMLDSLDAGVSPRETLYDGYVVNAVMDAAYQSAETGQWESVDVEWRGGSTPRISKTVTTHDGHAIVKEETLPDGRRKLILSDKDTGSVFDLVTSG
jgi:predicted dehydrogenase